MGNSNSGKRSNSMTHPYVRKAHHAGSWYSSDQAQLSATLEQYLAAVNLPAEHVQALTTTRSRAVRAIVCPHAGYAYSGPTAAYSYQALRHALSSSTQNAATKVTTLVVLHPSHHVYLSGCAVSGASHLATPLGQLTVDAALRDEILQIHDNNNNKTTPFSVMAQADDEHEHSGELQYPYLAHLLQQLNLLESVRVLPIMCGALSVPQETHYGRALAAILHRPNVVTVVSTDFCHWGARFQYQPLPAAPKHDDDVAQQKTPIHEYIAQLDRRGMDCIQDWQRPGAFADYLKDTRNTICGRHAVAVWLRAVEAAQDDHDDYAISFVSYAQSSAVTSVRDSSVSYAAALATSAATLQAKQSS